MADDLTPVLNKLQQGFGAQALQGGTVGARQQATGADALTAMLNQFQKMSQGSSAQLLNTLPEAQTVMSQYDAARSSMANLAPRGGMRASQGANLKFSELGNLGSMVQGARQQAAGAAEQAAGALTQAGQGEQGIAEQYLASVMQSQLERRQQNKDTALSHFTNALASSAGSMLGGGIGGSIADRAGPAIAKMII